MMQLGSDLCQGLKNTNVVYFDDNCPPVRFLLSVQKPPLSQPSTCFVSTFDLRHIWDIFAYSQNIVAKTNPIKSYVPQRAIYLVKAAVF